MRLEINRTEQFARPRVAREFAPLFDQLARPVDRAMVADGLRALAEWLGSPRRPRPTRPAS